MSHIFGSLRRLFYVFNTGESLDQVLKQSVEQSQTHGEHCIPCFCKAEKKAREERYGLFGILIHLGEMYVLLRYGIALGVCIQLLSLSLQVLSFVYTVQAVHTALLNWLSLMVVYQATTLGTPAPKTHADGLIFGCLCLLWSFTEEFSWTTRPFKLSSQLQMSNKSVR